MKECLLSLMLTLGLFSGVANATPEAELSDAQNTELLESQLRASKQTISELVAT